MIAFDDHPHLREAADGTGRACLGVTAAADVADLDAVAQPVTLIMLGWPPSDVRPTSGSGAADVADLFTACRLVAGGSACVIVSVRTAAADSVGSSPRAEFQQPPLGRRSPDVRLNGPGRTRLPPPTAVR